MFAIVEIPAAWDALKIAAEPPEAVRDAIKASRTEGFTWNKPFTFGETGNNTVSSRVAAQWRKHEETVICCLSCVYPEDTAHYQFIDPNA